MATVTFIVGFSERFRTVVITMIVMMAGGRIVICGRLLVVSVADFAFRGNRWRCSEVLSIERKGAWHDEHAKPGKHRYNRDAR